MVDIQADLTSSSSHLLADSISVRMDFSSPFYLHPSEIAGSYLLPAVFDGGGYRSWRKVILRTLSIRQDRIHQWSTGAT
ncbi:hypothetical protein KY290_033472 [Solanum tuberosum]|uniref:Retrotransposon Copia-like N-terminal domain-containing protein n=1 Tax=Solanum tuberosum TaxID=4113 RepID=A0ABQ7U1H2_SOLTU|nr:hypothetical protein KY289_032828 [Solanum tuberosum]KAH0647471.1 hypothetical protein KY285_032719 [Solanum tuberosum]KAH0740429.1 hypothetical protein KY290_033472 [Solanum tuberosum]